MNISVETPHYVLKDGSHATCPAIVQAPDAPACTVIYGFSKKSRYDAFLLNSPVALMPYPLVKRFLEDQMAASAGTLQLVVVDAKSAHESVLLASTYHSILAALTSGEGTVQTTHRLVLDEAAEQYRVDVVA